MSKLTDAIKSARAPTIKGLTLSFALATSVTTSAFSKESVWIFNGGDEQIKEIYVSSTRNGDWGVDRLGRDVLTRGNRIVVLPEEQGCDFDIRIVFDGGKSEERRAVNICENRFLVFNAAATGAPLQGGTGPSRIGSSAGGRVDSDSNTRSDVGPPRAGASGSIGSIVGGPSLRGASVDIRSGIFGGAAGGGGAVRDPSATARGGGSTAQNDVRQPGQASSASRPTTAGVLAPASRLYPARIFLPSSQIPPQGVGAYGVFALAQKATPANKLRLEAACKAYLASLPTAEGLPTSIKIEDQMLTIWPLVGDRPDTNYESCSHILDNYDLHGGQTAIGDAVAQGADLSGRGPFLLGWSPSQSRGVKDALVLIIDMSNYESQQSFDEAFRFWQIKIVEDPARWRQGFSIENFRVAVREFSDRYGQSIISSIKLLKIGGL